MSSLVTIPAAPQEPPERPKAVGVIGWIWVVLSILLFMKAVVNLISFTVLRSTSPGVVREALAGVDRIPAARWLLAHGGALFAFQAVTWILIGACAFGFLGLRRWGYVGIRTVCWLGILYAAAFFCFWLVVWRPAQAANPSLTPGEAARGLAAGLGASLLIAAFMVVMLVLVRRPRVRGAFGLVGPGGVEPPT